MPASTDVVERVRDVIIELRSLRTEMSQPDTDPTTGLANKKVPLEDARKLKNAVDEFRLFLWAYLDIWDCVGETPKDRLQKIRMQGAADMLALLTDEFQSTGLPSGAESNRLRSQINVILPLLR